VCGAVYVCGIVNLVGVCLDVLQTLSGYRHDAGNTFLRITSSYEGIDNLGRVKAQGNAPGASPQAFELLVV